MWFTWFSLIQPCTYQQYLVLVLADIQIQVWEWDISRSLHLEINNMIKGGSHNFKTVIKITVHVCK